MKVAVVAEEFWPMIGGGAGVSTTILVNQLRKKGFKVDVYVFRKSMPTIHSDNGFSKYYYVLNRRFYPLTNVYAILVLLPKLKQYDLVHVYSPMLMAAFGFLRKIFDVPIVATLNGFDAACLNYNRWNQDKCTRCTSGTALRCSIEVSKENKFIPFPLFFLPFIIQRFFAKKIDRYFALSESVQKIYLASGFRPTKLSIVPNMYDPLMLKNLRIHNIRKSNKKIVILYVGRLAKEKGVTDLLQAFLKLKNGKSELWIVGRGPEKSRLESLAKRYGAKNVKLIPFVKPSSIYVLYKQAHIFVHPGKWPEPFGRTILEAMLAKLAIITSDKGAPPLIIGNSGIVYEAGNIDQLTASLDKLIADPALRFNLGEKAYRKVLKEYAPEKITNTILNEYHKIKIA